MHSLNYFGLLAAVHVSLSSASYVLSPEDSYEGSTFFDKFNFYTGIDPTRGFVQYQDQSTASTSKLISVNDAKQAYIGVDSEKIYDANSPVGRASIRLETKKTYQYGLFVLDLAHMPSNTCGSWPAFWTTNDQDWPRWGEIDILENIHENSNSLEALHTGPGCSVAGNQISTQMSGNQHTYNCDGTATASQYGAQGIGQGCAADNINPNNYGSSFNSVGGGVYAMEWNKQTISIWHFSRGSVPNDLAAGTPNPSGWGQPVFTSAQGTCDIDGHFKDQKIIIDHTFCGNWAGQDAFWQQTSCYKSNPNLYPTCYSYVAANPGAYKESYWLVNSMKIYQDQNLNRNVNGQMSPASEPPASEAPASESPSGESPASEPPASESASSESPESDSPADYDGYDGEHSDPMPSATASNYSNATMSAPSGTASQILRSTNTASAVSPAAANATLQYPYAASGTAAANIPGTASAIVPGTPVPFPTTQNTQAPRASALAATFQEAAGSQVTTLEVWSLLVVFVATAMWAIM